MMAQKRVPGSQLTIRAMKSLLPRTRQVHGDASIMSATRWTLVRKSSVLQILPLSSGTVSSTAHTSMPFSRLSSSTLWSQAAIVSRSVAQEHAWSWHLIGSRLSGPKPSASVGKHGAYPLLPPSIRTVLHQSKLHAERTGSLLSVSVGDAAEAASPTNSAAQPTILEILPQSHAPSVAIRLSLVCSPSRLFGRITSNLWPAAIPPVERSGVGTKCPR